MNKFRSWLERFMYGRYGQDQLGLFLMAVAMILFLVSFFTVPYVYIPAVLLIIYAYFRMFSKKQGRKIQGKRLVSEKYSLGPQTLSKDQVSVYRRQKV